MAASTYRFQINVFPGLIVAIVRLLYQHSPACTQAKVSLTGRSAFLQAVHDDLDQVIGRVLVVFIVVGTMLEFASSSSAANLDSLSTTAFTFPSAAMRSRGLLLVFVFLVYSLIWVLVYHHMTIVRFTAVPTAA